METRTIDIHEALETRNEEAALKLRLLFERANVLVINIMSSPGAGKTALLARTLKELSENVRMGVIVGDVATDNDARRLQHTDTPVVQIVTHGYCHLEASMILKALEGIRLEEIDVLFLENVGNLVCPACFDLGEDLRIVMLSVTEGEDKPLKYPTAFQRADAVIVSKMDLAEAVEFDRAAALENIAAVAFHAPILETSARATEGLSSWYTFIQERLCSRRGGPCD